MKTNHGMKVHRELVETYGKGKPGGVWQRMTASEREWAEKFERLEYSIERGFAGEAVQIAKALNPNISQQAVERIKEDMLVKARCNPAKAESENVYQSSRIKTDRKPPANLYDASDWLRNAGMMRVKEENDAEEERGITLNPEDALIEALDAAAVHGVSLETFINNTQYWTPERKAGRPKKGINNES